MTRPSVACCACAFVLSVQENRQHASADSFLGLAFVVGLAHAREARERGVALCPEHADDLAKTCGMMAAQDTKGPLAPAVLRLDLSKPLGKA